MIVHQLIKFSIRPPRIRTHLRGDEAWNPWWKTILLIQFHDLLPMPYMSETDSKTTIGYL